MYTFGVVPVPEEAEPPGARGGGGEAGAEATLQQEARHQGRVQGHPAPRRAQGTHTIHIIISTLIHTHTRFSTIG